MENSRDAKMSFINKTSLTTKCEVNNAKEKILKSVIEAINDPDTVLKVVNEALMSEFDVWSSLIEKAVGKTKGRSREAMNPMDAKGFNSLLVKMVIEEVSLIFTEFKCFMEGCVTTGDPNNVGHDIRLPDQLSRASNKPLDQCYAALDHGSVSRFYKHIWMQEKKEVPRVVIPSLSYPSAPSDVSSSGEDIVDDVSDSGDSFDLFDCDFTNMRGEGMASTSVVANGNLDLDSKSEQTKCETLSNAPALEKRGFTDATKRVRRRPKWPLTQKGGPRRPEGLQNRKGGVGRSRLPFTKLKRRYFCDVADCKLEGNKSWPSLKLASEHHSSYHVDRTISNKPGSTVSKEFPTQETSISHQRNVHLSDSQLCHSAGRRELTVSVTRLDPEALLKVARETSTVDGTEKKICHKRRRKAPKYKKECDKLPITKKNKRFFCDVAGCYTGKSWASTLGVCYHLSSNHGDEDFCDKPCDQCHRKFPTFSSLSIHRNSSHKIEAVKNLSESC